MATLLAFSDEHFFVAWMILSGGAEAATASVFVRERRVNRFNRPSSC